MMDTIDKSDAPETTIRSDLRKESSIVYLLKSVDQLFMGNNNYFTTGPSQ